MPGALLDGPASPSHNLPGQRSRIGNRSWGQGPPTICWPEGQIGKPNSVDFNMTQGGIMARVTGSHLIGKALKLEGVTNIFTLAGDHILPMLDVMADQDRA